MHFFLCRLSEGFYKKVSLKIKENICITVGVRSILIILYPHASAPTVTISRKFSLNYMYMEAVAF